MSTSPNTEPTAGRADAELGPYCQSCAMPLGAPADFGTTAEGIRQNDYCHFCFAGGKFINPNITFEQMLELTVTMGAAATGMPAEAMRAAVAPLLPTLKRWRAPAA
jgi:Putative zinc ribbon domain